jgi:hypothetical protein
MRRSRSLLSASPDQQIIAEEILNHNPQEDRMRKKSNYRIVKRNQFYCVYDLAQNRLVAVFRNKRKTEGWIRVVLKGEVWNKCLDESIFLHIRCTVGWYSREGLLNYADCNGGKWSNLAEIWDLERVLLNHYHYREEG